MVFWLCRKYVRSTLLLVAGSAFSLSIQAAVNGHAGLDGCVSSLASAQQQLNKVRAEIERIETRLQYQESLKNRYDTVEALLHRASLCLESEGIDKALAQDWEKIVLATASLRATARESAFTDFSGWLKARENDLNALKSIAGNGTPADAGGQLPGEALKESPKEAKKTAKPAGRQ